jgi:hypothetical protein
VSPPSEATIQALAATLTPSLTEDDERLRRIYSNFCYIYGDLPDDTQTKLALLVRVIEGWSWLRHGRSIASLSLDHRTALCQSIATAPIGRLQAGFSGLRALLFNATYTEPVTWDQIGYAGPTIDEGVGERERGGTGVRESRST